NQTGTPLTWFPGCSARYLFPDIIDSCQSLLADMSFSLQYPEGLACCGLASQAAGDIEGAKKSGRKNIEVMETTTGPILVSCASCYAHLKHYPDLFADDVAWQARSEKMASRVVEMSDLLETQKEKEKQLTSKQGQKLKVFYHDPCHLCHGTEDVDRARQQLQKTGQIEVVELPNGPRCCGQGGLFHVAQPEISASIRDQLVQDVLALEPDVVTTTCSGCLMQWQQGLSAAKSDVKVVHLAQLLEQERK
ncbi:MAG: (Fe-S)-binding protein, partial [Desulfocapsa sp.]|nr:(Fe-S)-binding protein [Desulfocapsa sp.]